MRSPRRCAAQGFEVVEREDVVERRHRCRDRRVRPAAAASPGSSALVYSLRLRHRVQRPAVPAAGIREYRRPADVLTQGVLAKSLIDVLAAGQSRCVRGGDRRGAGAGRAGHAGTGHADPDGPAGGSRPDRGQPGKAAGRADAAGYGTGGHSEGIRGADGAAAGRRCSSRSPGSRRLSPHCDHRSRRATWSARRRPRRRPHRAETIAVQPAAVTPPAPQPPAMHRCPPMSR